jgi:hypothetical protein
MKLYNMTAILSVTKHLLKQICRLTLLLGIAYISGCTNKDAERGQFDNNSSGMDQDHTAAPPDTVMINESEIDTSHSVQSKSVDSLSKR